MKIERGEVADKEIRCSKCKKKRRKRDMLLDGRRCKLCQKKMARSHYERNREAYDTARRRTSGTLRRWCNTQVDTALKNGTLKKRPCEECGVKKVVAHHDDYSRPLVVRWLCRTHHLLWHSTFGEARCHALEAPSQVMLYASIPIDEYVANAQELVDDEGDMPPVCFYKGAVILLRSYSNLARYLGASRRAVLSWAAGEKRPRRDRELRLRVREYARVVLSFHREKPPWTPSVRPKTTTKESQAMKEILKAKSKLHKRYREAVARTCSPDHLRRTMDTFLSTRFETAHDHGATVRRQLSAMGFQTTKFQETLRWVMFGDPSSSIEPDHENYEAQPEEGPRADIDFVLSELASMTPQGKPLGYLVCREAQYVILVEADLTNRTSVDKWSFFAWCQDDESWTTDVYAVLHGGFSSLLWTDEDLLRGSLEDLARDSGAPEEVVPQTVAFMGEHMGIDVEDKTGAPAHLRHVHILERGLQVK